MNIVLTGFMGSGKSTVGKVLAEKTVREFVDLDLFIENKISMYISDIFALMGETAFRKFESEAISELSAQENTVIASGGGAVLNPDNVAAFKKNGIIIHLNVSAKILLERLKLDYRRPLLAGDMEQTVVSLLTQRRPVYKAVADYTIAADGTAEEVVNEILKLSAFCS